MCPLGMSWWLVKYDLHVFLGSEGSTEGATESAVDYTKSTASEWTFEECTWKGYTAIGRHFHFTKLECVVSTWR